MGVAPDQHVHGAIVHEHYIQKNENNKMRVIIITENGTSLK